MDIKVFLAAFWAILLAELADKTQLAGITMSATTGKPFTVWLGSVAAFSIASAVSVTLGMLLNRYIKPEFIRYFGGIVFIVMGTLILFKKI